MSETPETLNPPDSSPSPLVRARPEFEQLLAQRFDAHFESRPAHAGAGMAALHDAMRYGLLGGGKRVRAMLVLAAASLGGGLALASPPADHPATAYACAIEAIHAFSLIHDDLPCMDDDDLRRGRPTVHIAFDEGLALLAGDALQTLGFEWAGEAALPAAQTLTGLQILARATGGHGMAAGQAVDVCAVGQSMDAAALSAMHRLKTGALFEAAVALGVLCWPSNDAPTAREEGGRMRPPGGADGFKHPLSAYAQAIGLGFQVVDDVLDATQSTATLGKTAGKDADANKPTYVSLWGLDGARREADRLHEAARAALVPYGLRAAPLLEIAHQVFSRTA